MSDPSTSKPDLDDDTNVSIDAAAVKRENQMFTQGSEPISLWVILGGALIILIAGGVIAGSIFDYNNYVKPGYVRATAPGAASAATLPKSALDATLRLVKSLTLLVQVATSQEERVMRPIHHLLIQSG